MTYLHTVTSTLKAVSESQSRLLSATMASPEAEKARLIFRGNEHITVTLQMPDASAWYDTVYYGTHDHGDDVCRIDDQKDGEVTLTLIPPPIDTQAEHVVEIVKGQGK